MTACPNSVMISYHKMQCITIQSREHWLSWEFDISQQKHVSVNLSANCVQTLF